MHKHPAITKDRIRQFIDFQLRECLFEKVAELPTEFLSGKYRNQEAAQSTKGWVSIQPGFNWGPAYQEGWYRINQSIPSHLHGQSLALGYGDFTNYQWESYGMVEGTLWENNIQIGGLDFGHSFFRIPEDSDSLEIYIQTYAHNKETTVHRPEKPRTLEPEDFKGFSLLLINEDLLPLFYDAEFAYDLMLSHAEDDPAYLILMQALNQVCNTYNPQNTKTIRTCRKIIKTAQDSIATEYNHTLYPLGHAHLDTAWLWPLAVTKLKMAHTTTVQLELAERYPEHVYVHSQASQYEWLENDQPALFERVKKAIRRNNWEPLGSMWVEADCNLTGGEALIRQFLYGRRYFKSKFGVETIDMFLPDVFGYSAALPQILKLFNIKAFLTQKMSWNQFNKIPHNTFWWKGIDGSSIWTHFPPVDTYVGSCSAQEMVKGVKKHRDHTRSDSSLYLYGFGDGGGGPTEFHLERLRRARNAPGLPVIEKNVKASDFYKTAIDNSQDLQTWSGELYFEYHRGTYTTQASNKRDNRRSEFLLRDLEYLATVHPQFPNSYPKTHIEELWKLVLLNQFHDIIPGSSVKEVYEDSARDYAKVIGESTALIHEQIKAIAQAHCRPSAPQCLALFHNATIASQVRIPWNEDLTKLPGSVTCQLESLPVQFIQDPNGPALIFSTPQAALGAVCVAELSAQSAPSAPRLKVSNRKLENDTYAVRFDTNGNITSIQTLDDEPTEFITPGSLANVFQLLDDRPLFWDAWDVDVFSQETVKSFPKADSFEIVESGPVRVAVETMRTVGSSTIRQRISLGPTPGIRFDTWVDWKEDHKMLKVAFPINVNTSKATFEIQFGHVERPTHRNTSWELAKFEVCAQKWADLSEGGHGVALINTGKYGHDVHENILRLSLLRSPKAPDPTCDRGLHHFTYVLLPHYDQLPQSEVVAAAYAINAEPHAIAIDQLSGDSESLEPYYQVDQKALIIESVKKAEDSDNIICRLYESLNTRGIANLKTQKSIKKAWKCDCEENKLEDLDISDGNVHISYKPFEIVTIMME